MSAFRINIAPMNIGTPEIIFVLQLKYINICKGISDPEHYEQEFIIQDLNEKKFSNDKPSKIKL